MDSEHKLTDLSLAEFTLWPRNCGNHNKNHNNKFPHVFIVFSIKNPTIMGC